MARRTRAKKMSSNTSGMSYSSKNTRWMLMFGWIIPLVLALGSVFTPGALWTTASFWGLILVILGLLTGYGYNIKESMSFLMVAVLFVIFMQWAPVASVLYLGTFINTFLSWFLIYLSPLVFVVLFRKIYSMLS